MVILLCSQHTGTHFVALSEPCHVICQVLLSVHVIISGLQWSIQVGDLQYASPATVSRCGMVYVDPKNLGYIPYWERWVNSLPSEGDKKEFCRLFDKYVSPCISLILEGVMDGRQGEKLKTITPVTNLNMVRHSVFSEKPNSVLKPKLKCMVKTNTVLKLTYVQELMCVSLSMAFVLPCM